jgi:hypothetical protein
VNTITSRSAFAKLFSVYVLPSMPGSENGGMAAPMASVGGCSDAYDAPANEAMKAKAITRTNCVQRFMSAPDPTPS